ncbi:MAG: peptide chain release factor-like protein [Pirellulales bacterium]|nr:peptide chain release factor-like protein [Pirellulales bacterium]
MVHPAELPIDDLLAECAVERKRRSGPGGQHRNKVETAVVIVHLPTGVRAEASERRSQAENQSRAAWRLRLELALAVRSSREALPSPLWRRRAGHGRIAVRQGHDDYPALVAEALDALAACEWSPAAAGEKLGVTGSQLVRLLKIEPRVLAVVNIERRRRGAGVLR